MSQNIYDDPTFFDGYSKMPRSVGGLGSAEEWPVLRGLLPGLAGKRLLDLGCGFGWHCRYARQQGAAYVLGVDISAQMLERARALGDDQAIEYRHAGIEEVDLRDEEFDVVISSLAFHYVERYDAACRKVSSALAEGGAFVFSVEHPMFTSRPEQDWCVSPDGRRLHWPVDHYQEEGVRHTNWLADDVIKYHRTIATYLNTLIESGFRILAMAEAGVSAERAQECPELKDERRRPMMLLVAAQKPVTAP
jgi:SAM-dependent methyltransferase